MSSECKIIPDNAFKVMSYNVQNLSNNNLHIQDESLRDKIFSTLNTEKPDIICMQEFYYSGSNKTELINDLQKSLNLPYSYKKNYFPRKIHVSWFHKSDTAKVLFYDEFNYDMKYNYMIVDSMFHTRSYVLQGYETGEMKP